MRKRVMKWTGMILLAMLAVCALGNEHVRAADSDFIIKKGVLISYTGTDREVKVPDGVTEIGEGAFNNNIEAVEKVVLPDGLKTIGRSAFSHCSSLETINFPKGLETIDENAFLYCDSLKKVSLPSSLKNVGNYAFRECSKLTEVSVYSSAALQDFDDKFDVYMIQKLTIDVSTIPRGVMNWGGET